MKYDRLYLDSQERDGVITYSIMTYSGEFLVENATFYPEDAEKIRNILDSSEMVFCFTMEPIGKLLSEGAPADGPHPLCIGLTDLVPDATVYDLSKRYCGIYEDHRDIKSGFDTKANCKCIRLVCDDLCRPVESEMEKRAKREGKEHN